MSRTKLIISTLLPYKGCGRNNSHILKVNKNQTKQGTQKFLLFIKSTYDAIFFSNTFKGRRARRPGTIEQLKEAILQKVAAIPPTMTRKAMDNFRERLQECVINNGRHLSDVIFKSASRVCHQ